MHIFLCLCTHGPIWWPSPRTRSRMPRDTPRTRRSDTMRWRCSHCGLLTMAEWNEMLPCLRCRSYGTSSAIMASGSETMMICPPFFFFAMEEVGCCCWPPPLSRVFAGQKSVFIFKRQKCSPKSIMYTFWVIE